MFGKKLTACAMAVVLACGMMPGLAHAEVRKADVVMGQTVEERGLSVSQSPSIGADHAALVSSDGDVYFTRDGEGESQIASITKVMTAIVTLDHARTDTMVTVSQAAAEIGESSANLQQGDTMDLSSALKALLVPPGNDAAVALAETVGATMLGNARATGDESVSAFVDAMNAKAAEIGLENTVYENPHGLDDGEYAGNLHSTALDQTKVAKCAMTYPEIRSIVSGGSTSIQVHRAGKVETVELETTDLLLDMYDFAIGIKTGVTNLAGPSFMGAANKDGRELYAVVLGSEDEYSRFEDAQKLFDWAYGHFVEYSYIDTDVWTTMRKDGSSAEVPVVAEAPHTEWIDRSVKATIADSENAMTVFDLEGNVNQKIELDELHGTVDVGDKVGTMTLLQQNKPIKVIDLVACERIESPNPIDTIAIWWQRFTQGLEGQKAYAPEKVHNVLPLLNDNRSSAA